MVIRTLVGIPMVLGSVEKRVEEYLIDIYNSVSFVRLVICR